MQLKNRIAIVTGGANGIGKSIVYELAKLGAVVIIADIDIKRAKNVENRIIRIGQMAKAIMIDVSKREDVDQVIEATVEDYKRIDILINNAGIAQKLGNIYRLSKEDWDQLIAVNLTGVINCIRAVSKYMVRQRYGKIVNISSVVGLTGGLGLVGYSASKAGIVGVTKSAAKEFAKYKINVNCIAPGFIDTDLWRILKDDQRKRLTELILFGRMGTPMDIAHCVCFLASDLSNYITGSVIPVDGGLTLGNY